MSTRIHKSSAITLPPPSAHKDPIPTAWPGGMMQRPQQRQSSSQQGLPQPASLPRSSITVLGADIIAETFGGQAKKNISVPTCLPTSLFPSKDVGDGPKEAGAIHPHSVRPHLLPPPNLPPHLPPIPLANVPLAGMADKRHFPSPVSQQNAFNPSQLHQHQQHSPLEKPGWAQNPRGGEFMWPDNRGPPPTPPQPPGNFKSNHPSPGNFNSNRQSPYTWQRSDYSQNRRPSYEEERQRQDSPRLPHLQQQRQDTQASSQNPYVYRRPDAELPSAPQQRDPRITAGDPLRGAPPVGVPPLIRGGGPGSMQQRFPGKEGLGPSGPRGPPISSSDDRKEFHQGRPFPSQSAMGELPPRLLIGNSHDVTIGIQPRMLSLTLSIRAP